MHDDIISRSAAEAILQPHIDVVGLCLWNAWDRWGQSTSVSVPISARSRASLVYDYAVAEAWQLLNGREGLRLTEQRGFLLVSVEDRLLLRFKKFRKGFVTSGIPTAQQQLFACQQLTIDGMPRTQIVAGYLLDEFQRSIASVAITCSYAGRLMWRIDIPRGGMAANVVPISAPKDRRLPAPTLRSLLRRDEEQDQSET